MPETIDYKNAYGYIMDGEADLLFRLAKEAGPGAVIINIGIEYGKSLACLRAGNQHAEIFGVDLDTSKVFGGGFGAHLFQTNSAEFVDGWKSEPRPIDLIFLDGDHGKTGVLKDAELADFLKVGGHILFQDCWSWIGGVGVVHELVPGVNEAVTEWFSNHRYEFEELPSVDTTRVFRRVAIEVEEGYGTTGSSDLNTELQSGPATGGKPKTDKPKSPVRREGKSSSRR